MERCLKKEEKVEDDKRKSDRRKADRRNPKNAYKA